MDRVPQIDRCFLTFSCITYDTDIFQRLDTRREHCKLGRNLLVLMIFYVTFKVPLNLINGDEDKKILRIILKVLTNENDTQNIKKQNSNLWNYCLINYFHIQIYWKCIFLGISPSKTESHPFSQWIIIQFSIQNMSLVYP